MAGASRKVRAAYERDRVTAGPADYPKGWLTPAETGAVQPGGNIASAAGVKEGGSIASAAGVHSKGGA